jgi:GWxTD domain-containing protein
MMVRIPAYILLTTLAMALIINGCASRLKTPADQAIDKIFYISTPAQRHQLKELQSQEAVDAFLENFWAKLDPYPDTPENEFKEMYLQRYEYANEHFRYGPILGSRTDRGRIYIIFGPPDEIREEPVFQELSWQDQVAIGDNSYQFSQARVKAYEIWNYYESATDKVRTYSTNFLCKTFVFGDLTGCGLYTLVYSNDESELDDSRMY